MPLTKARMTGPLLAAATAAVVAGCGSSSSHPSTIAAASSGASTATTRNATANATPTPTASAAATPIVITTKHDKKLGTILAAGGKRLTVYLWERDRGASSACSGACAAAWPAVIGKPSAAGSARNSELGTITRVDGTTQVTYKGHPLYYFVKDKDAGDAYGENVNAFGADWYVLRPTGNKVDPS